MTTPDEEFEKWCKDYDLYVEPNYSEMTKADCKAAWLARVPAGYCVVKRGPTIVCLCGSTRFKDAFDEATYQETMAGRIVLSVGFYMHATGNRHGQDVGATPEQKIALDELHKRKVELADEVLILNVGGYIGESTRNELSHAILHRKKIRYLEPVMLAASQGEKS